MSLLYKELNHETYGKIKQFEDGWWSFSDLDMFNLVHLMDVLLMDDNAEDGSLWIPPGLRRRRTETVTVASHRQMEALVNISHLLYAMSRNSSLARTFLDRKLGKDPRPIFSTLLRRQSSDPSAKAVASVEHLRSSALYFFRREGLTMVLKMFKMPVFKMVRDTCLELLASLLTVVDIALDLLHKKPKFVMRLIIIVGKHARFEYRLTAMVVLMRLVNVIVDYRMIGLFKKVVNMNTIDTFLESLDDPCASLQNPQFHLFLRFEECMYQILAKVLEGTEFYNVWPRDSRIRLFNHCLSQMHDSVVRTVDVGLHLTSHFTTLPAEHIVNAENAGLHHSLDTIILMFDIIMHNDKELCRHLPNNVSMRGLINNLSRKYCMIPFSRHYPYVCRNLDALVKRAFPTLLSPGCRDREARYRRKKPAGSKRAALDEDTTVVPAGVLDLNRLTAKKRVKIAEPPATTSSGSRSEPSTDATISATSDAHTDKTQLTKRKGVLKHLCPNIASARSMLRAKLAKSSLDTLVSLDFSEDDDLSILDNISTLYYQDSDGERTTEPLGAERAYLGITTVSLEPQMISLDAGTTDDNNNSNDSNNNSNNPDELNLSDGSEYYDLTEEQFPDIEPRPRISEPNSQDEDKASDVSHSEFIEDFYRDGIVGKRVTFRCTALQTTQDDMNQKPLAPASSTEWLSSTPTSFDESNSMSIGLSDDSLDIRQPQPTRKTTCRVPASAQPPTSLSSDEDATEEDEIDAEGKRSRLCVSDDDDPGKRSESFRRRSARMSGTSIFRGCCGSMAVMDTPQRGARSSGLSMQQIKNRLRQCQIM